jgi:hypothetical protein
LIRADARHAGGGGGIIRSWMANKMKKNRKPPDPEWDHVFKSNYASACFWDIDWLYVADDLLECATILEPRVNEVFQRMRAHTKDRSVRLISQGVLSVHFMLVSYAIENLFKGALVRENSQRYKNDFGATKKFPEELQEHDLVRLATLTRFTLDLAREDLLRRLTRCAIWHGRYPVPLDYRELSGTETFKDGKIYSVGHFGKGDVDRLKTLVQDIRAELGLKSSRIPS